MENFRNTLKNILLEILGNVKNTNYIRICIVKSENCEWNLKIPHSFLCLFLELSYVIGSNRLVEREREREAWENPLSFSYHEHGTNPSLTLRRSVTFQICCWQVPTLCCIRLARLWEKGWKVRGSFFYCQRPPSKLKTYKNVLLFPWGCEKEFNLANFRNVQSYTIVVWGGNSRTYGTIYYLQSLILIFTFPINYKWGINEYFNSERKKTEDSWIILINNRWEIDW